MRKATLLFAILLVLLSLVVSATGQRAIRITPENRAAIHSQLGIRQSNASGSWKDHPDRHQCDHDRNCVQIGTFTTIMWLDGQAMYEFDWANCDGIVGGCSDSNANHYTGPIESDNAIVFVKGSSLSWASSGQGPINTGQYLGLAFFTDSASSSSLDNCQPLTSEGIDTVIGGDTIFSYKTNCIDVALQLVSSGATNTFSLLNGQSFTAYGVENTFIFPLLGNADLYTYCDQWNFCRGQTVPVFMHRVREEQ